MSTSATSPAKPAFSKTRILVGGFFALLLGLAVVALWFYSIARSSLPQLDGTLLVPGLSAPVAVVRDQQGVPHLKAANLEDLFLAQGYVTAQDRLWQMDILRRYAAGELSEVLGLSTLELDRRKRVLQFRSTARKAAEAANPADRSYMEAYARGVNAFMDSHRDRLPPEFRILGYQPQPWKLEDSYLMGLNLYDQLNLFWVEDLLLREKVAAKIGPELAAELYPNISPNDHPPGVDLTPVNKEPLQSRVLSRGFVHPLSAPAAALPTAPELIPGSNDWVLSGARTASGKPLLSNDMHLAHSIPNIWYEAHLQAPGYNVAGVTLPGFPFVVVGHNEHIAWGFTNVGPASLDLDVETFNDRGEYETPAGWQAPEHRHEAIKVRGKSDVIVDAVLTRHGPIVSSLIPGEKRQLALHWVAYDPQAVQVPLFDLNSAHNWDEFLRAMARFGGPAQNAVYGDVDGHIGYHTVGFIPVRVSGDGLTPLAGSDNSHEWSGYIPFDRLPSSYDPSSGVLATANGRITPDGYPFLISYEWGPPQRTDRIYNILHSKQKFSAQDALALQTDIYSSFDHFLARRLSAAVDYDPRASQRAKEAATILRGWDGMVRADSVAPTLTSAARRQLTRLLLEPKLGSSPDNLAPDAEPTGWSQYKWFMSSVWLESLLTNQPAHWLPAGVTSYDDLLASAIEAVVTQKSAPANLASWRWGEQIALDLKDPVLNGIPILRRWAGPGRYLQSGNGFTVKQVGAAFGPSERMTVDFSNLDASTLNLANGQSGHFLSPHFNDQWQAWYQGRTFNLGFSNSAIEQSKAHELLLQPQK